MEKDIKPSQPSEPPKSTEPVPSQQPAEKVKKKAPKKMASPEPSLSSADSSPSDRPAVVPDTPIKKPVKKSSVKKPNKEAAIQETRPAEESAATAAGAKAENASSPVDTPSKETSQDDKVGSVVESKRSRVKSPSKIPELSPLTVKEPVPIKPTESLENSIQEKPVESPVSPTSSISSQDFKLASTVHLDQLIRSEIGHEVEPLPAMDRMKKENALKVKRCLQNFITEYSITPKLFSSSTFPCGYFYRIIFH